MSIHACYIGSKVVVSLYALQLGASQAMVGVLAACYAIVPLILGVYTGRLADTRGMRLPLLIGAITTAVAMMTGFLWRDLSGLFAVAALMGGAFSVSVPAGTYSVPVHPNDRSMQKAKSRNGRPASWWWTTTTTLVRE